MTTIVWDGKELVADGQATRMVAAQTGKRNSIRDFKDVLRKDVVKIFTGGAFLFEGEPVQAMGYAGDWDLGEHVVKLSYNNSPIELTSAEVQDLLVARGLPISLLLVTAKNALVIAVTAEIAQGVQIIRQERSTPLVIGSGIDKIKSCFFLPGATARDYVGFCAYADIYTGGLMSVWDGRYVHVGMKMQGKLRSVFNLLKLSYRYTMAQRRARKTQPAQVPQTV